MQTIMIIRHAEKPVAGIRDRSVCIDGFHARHELTVRGWQRAAALVRFFVPPHDRPAGHPIRTPASIFAAAATETSPSLRSQRTVQPLAEALHLAVNCSLAEGEETQLAAALVLAASPVLVAWHHHSIPALVREIAGQSLAREGAGQSLACPADWPDDRFDVVWILARAAPEQNWSFAQHAQLLVPRDRGDVIQSGVRAVP